jgi:hypothetical protein
MATRTRTTARKPAKKAAGKKSPASTTSASRKPIGAASGAAPPGAGPANPSAFGGPTMQRILLIDLSRRESDERAKLKVRGDRLEALKRTEATSGGLSADQEIELRQIQRALSSDGPVDPLFEKVAATLQHSRVTLKHGLFSSQLDAAFAQGPQVDLTETEQELAFVCGLLQLDNNTLTTAESFVNQVTSAQGEYRKNKALFKQAYETFKGKYVVSLDSQIKAGEVDEDVLGCIFPRGPGNKLARAFGDVPARTDPVDVLSGRNVAGAVRKLAADRITADNAWIKSRLESAYNLQTGVVDGAPPSAIEISLPNLEEDVDIEIQAENLKATQAIYFSYQLEEMRIFQVVERIVELFRQGMLPLGRNSVGDKLFNYYKKAVEHITEAERRDLYLRCFGAPGGNPANEPNRDFNELWMRFISAVSSLSRQQTVEKLLRSNLPMAVSQEQVRKAARDLGANLSRSGYGMAWYAATDLQASIIEFRDILSDAELRSCFGARDMWQVIDQVNVNYLGGARNTHRYRTQSRAGAVIIGWIAKKVQRLASVGGPVIELEQLSNPQLRAVGGASNPTLDPTDWDLINACEQWLAVGGVQDQSVDQYSQPIETPTMTSRPIEIPQIARDMLSGSGIALNGSGVPAGLNIAGM